MSASLWIRSRFIGRVGFATLLVVAAGTRTIAAEEPLSSSARTDASEESIPGFSHSFNPQRPATVPFDFLPTPNGWFHPSCIIEVREDERVRGLRIEHATGTTRDIARCQHPHYSRSGNPIFSDIVAPTVNGWAARADDVITAIEWLSATWAVPSNPSSNTGQTVYLFPGLEPATTGDTILQPVLAWNGLYAPAGWAIYSWNCCRNGSQIHSTAVPVSAGETISGYVWGTNCNGLTGVCNTWQVRTSSTNNSSTLDTDSYGESLDWVFGGALEVYGVSACNQYPASSSVSYQNLTAHQVGGATLTPAWSTSITAGVTPNCVTGVDATADSVTIRWCVPSTCSGRCGTMSDGCGGTLSCGGCTGTGRKCFDGEGGWFYSGMQCLSGYCVSAPCP